MIPPDAVGVVHQVLQPRTDEHGRCDREQDTYETLGLGWPGQQDAREKKEKDEASLAVQSGCAGKRKNEVVRLAEKAEQEGNPLEACSLPECIEEGDDEQDHEGVNEGAIEEHAYTSVGHKEFPTRGDG